MKYKLPRQVFAKDIGRIISREIKRQNWVIARVSKKNLKEIAEVTDIIRAEGLPKNLVCKKLGTTLGYGIFLHPKAEPILKGQVIAPYAGQTSLVLKDTPEEGGTYAFTPVENMRLTKEEQLLIAKHRRYSKLRRYSFKVDASKKGNFTRFINHSDKPNVEARTVYVPKNSYRLAPSCVEVLYVAKKTILPGQQLLVSYEAGENCYWIHARFKPIPMTPTTYQLNAKLKVQKS